MKVFCPELLAPAGNAESMQAALNAGADAVYFGMGNKNARAAARNFDKSGAKEGIDRCHERGAKAYLTLNTLLTDSEMVEVMGDAAYLYACGADAFIVQDMGLLLCMRKEFPEIALHGSTQMSIVNEGGLQVAQELGLQRAVLGRECSVADIELMAKDTPVELEVFVQGAMCVSVSGQCLHSSLIGGRSGNRGGCAQPCRMRYESQGENGYLLSMKDQNLLQELPRLAKAGVDSVKIEGRMKSPAYVEQTVSLFRSALDEIRDGRIFDFKQERDRLASSFGRSGTFSHGYAYDAEDLIDSLDPSYGRSVNAEASEEPNKRLVPVRLHFSGIVNEKACLTISALGEECSVEGETVQVAQKAPVSKDRLHDALAKMGGTPYEAMTIKIDWPEDGFLPMSAVNALRREAVGALETALTEKARREQPKAVGKTLQNTALQPKEKQALLRAQVENEEQARAALDAGADELILFFRDWRTPKSLRRWQNWLASSGHAVPTLLKLPPVILPEGRRSVENCLQELDTSLFQSLLIGNVGEAELARRYFPENAGDFSLNVCNREAITTLQALDITEATLSVEITGIEMAKISQTSPKCATLVYGKIPTMTLLHCPIRRKLGHCGHCEKGTIYVDRKQEQLPLHPQYLAGEKNKDPVCVWQMYNAHPLDLSRFGRRLLETQLSHWQLLFSDETPGKVHDTIKRFVALRSGERVHAEPGSTGGHFDKGFQQDKTVVRQTGSKA